MIQERGIPINQPGFNGMIEGCTEHCSFLMIFPSPFRQVFYHHPSDLCGLCDGSWGGTDLHEVQQHLSRDQWLGEKPGIPLGCSLGSSD